MQCELMTVHMLRSLLVILPLLASGNALAERVFTEKTLNDWGYETVEISQVHRIRSLDDKAESGPSFYVRFWLWKECFDSPEQAASHVDDIESERHSSSIGVWKNYQRQIQSSECVYYLKTDSRAMHLSYQPELIRLIKAHVSR